MGSTYHKDCLHYMRYAGRHYCKLVWHSKPMEPPTELVLGCLGLTGCNDTEYAPQPWKAEVYNDEQDTQDAQNKKDEKDR